MGMNGKPPSEIRDVYTHSLVGLENYPTMAEQMRDHSTSNKPANLNQRLTQNLFFRMIEISCLSVDI
tara:strand:+ start:71 stop:271 length:201 start_codon:yes stop_codon:yes gene_type:complete